MEWDLINTEENTGSEASRYFNLQFSEDCLPEDFSMLECIPKLIFTEDNEAIARFPSSEEIKVVVLSLSRDKAGGSNGFDGCFYQHCWDIIGEDIELMVRAFFCGHQLPGSSPAQILSSF